MARRKIGPDEITLPKGTRVVLRTARTDDEGNPHPEGTLAVVRSGAYHSYVVETPGGARLSVQRDQIRLQKEELLEALGRRQWAYRQLKDHVILATVVGSQAWGLADEHSDEDVRGCFVLPFEAHASLWEAPDEIHDDAGGEEAFWEIEKLLHQGLRGDANTLEMLWSPLVRTMTPLGKELVERRRMFVSMNLLGSFGRYATSQLDKVRRSLVRKRALEDLLDEVERGAVRTKAEARAVLPEGEDLAALVRSLFDRGLLPQSSFEALVEAVEHGGAERLRPEEVRPKNAYNLVRLLHSCVSWLRTGEPLIRVEGPLRDTLLSIKHGEIPIEKTLALAEEAAREVDEAARASKLPPSPDHAAADELLLLCRREAARRFFALLPAGSLDLHPSSAPTSSLDVAEPGSDEAGASSPGAPSLGGMPPGAPPPADLFAPRFFPEPLPPDVDPGSTRRFLERFVDGERSIRPRSFLFIGLTGAHAYGFPSPDSDLDIKAIDAAPAERLLGLSPEVEPVERIEVFEGREMDLSSHELGQAVRLLLKGNGNMLERLLGPLPLFTTPAGERLAALAKGSLSRRLVHHYRGFFGGMRREYALEEARGQRRAKRLLYAYRVALTGAHVLLTGELVTDVRPLAEEHGFLRVKELIARKSEAEKQELTEAEAAPCLADFGALEQLLDDALARSPLPEEPENERALDAFLVEARTALSGACRSGT